MLKTTFRTLVMAGALTLSVSAIADEKKDDPVVATVNGVEIYYSQVQQAQRAMGGQAMAVPLEMIQSMLINTIADRTIVAEQARKDGFDKNEEFKKRMADIEQQVLARDFIADYAEKQITDKRVEEAYQAMIKDFEPQKEVHARHILVEDEAAAKDVIKELEGGADFVELAKTKSTGPSGPQGGDLGFFSAGAMVPEFEKAAFALKAGEFSKEPVKTQFGYHVIKLEEERKTQPPKLEDVKDQIEGEIGNEAVSKYIEGLRKDAKIVLFDKDGKEIKEDK
ncbi:peptidylprolyl isomerase [Terasakiella pusilla]|jgi:peptidyl-prolyl cis-trans isomerase C|uniref:peptidylprolyl isomerase n=1 Tax=Terasakiella pusilla TaxID=64973 RepID=UPI00048EDF1B|nr:peptidylprolyl isomerase [Terasakiella pusilla]